MMNQLFRSWLQLPFYVIASVTWLVTVACTFLVSESWLTIAINGLVTGSGLCMLLFIHSQQEQRLYRTILEQIRLMLKDQILNQLAIIMLTFPNAVQTDETTQRRVERIQQAVMRISDTINNLSEETLQQWIDLDNQQHL